MWHETKGNVLGFEVQFFKSRIRVWVLFLDDANFRIGIYFYFNLFEYEYTFSEIRKLQLQQFCFELN